VAEKHHPIENDAETRRWLEARGAFWLCSGGNEKIKN
jgi:hypothetical protein